ncbi:MAG: hypothetical protein ACE5E9_11590 [Nitrospinaceae bacterium]
MGPDFFSSNPNYAHQTLNYPVNLVDEATQRVLYDMEILILDNDRTRTGKKIKGTTIDFDLLIELEALNSKTTRMRVKVRNGVTETGKPAAAEIIQNTRLMLNDFAE